MYDSNRHPKPLFLETKLNIRLANESDVTAINAFYNSVYGKQRDEKKFHWEYNSAPAGKAIYVLAEYNGEIVGTQAAIPYFLTTGRAEKILSAKSEDTLVSPLHRGKHIFEKMYALLFEECKKHHIRLIWGFTYADKPFKKLEFKVPYKACMGVLVKDIQRSANYFTSLAANRSVKEKFGIRVLSIYSKLKALLQMAFSKPDLPLQSGTVSYSGEAQSYLHSAAHYGLLLDTAFLDYRISNNPYEATYQTLSYYENKRLKASITYSLTEQQVCYIIHLYLSADIRLDEMKRFMKSVLSTEHLRNACVIRFWGFRHNTQNKKELDVLSACGFTFINKGIYVVWKSLDAELGLQPEDFVLSRMASQGTD